MSLNAKGAELCLTNDPSSCTLIEGSIAYWIKTHYEFLIGMIVLAGAMIVFAHLNQKAHENKSIYALILVVLTCCVAYISVFVCSNFFASSPKTVIANGIGTSISATAFTALLYHDQELPDFKRIAVPMFASSAFFLIFFTWVIGWNDFATNGMISLWLLIFGFFVWFDTDFAKENMLHPRDFIVADFFIYFLFILFIYCLCT